MSSTAFYLAVSGAVAVSLMCVILAGMLARRLYPPDDEKQMAAHEEALVHLVEVVRAGADRAPNPGLVRLQVAAVLEILEYPQRGDVGAWEAQLVGMIYGEKEEDPVEPWPKAQAALFEFARVNLYCGFVKTRNVAAYEQARACLSAVGLEAMPAAALSLGRL